jgi:hypothetical protein
LAWPVGSATRSRRSPSIALPEVRSAYNFIASQESDITHATGYQDPAVRFEQRAKELMLTSDFRPLMDYETLGSDAIP